MFTENLMDAHIEFLYQILTFLGLLETAESCNLEEHN
jgi:hypothetical protein